MSYSLVATTYRVAFRTIATQSQYFILLIAVFLTRCRYFERNLMDRAARFLKSSKRH